MSKNNFCMSLCTTIFLLFSFTITALANSSWRWISESRPYDVLPFVIVFTLFAETYTIKHYCRIIKTDRVFIPVFIGNIISYFMPYAVDILLVRSEHIYTLSEFWQRGHFYTVGTVYLFMTLVAEIPVVYAFLKKKATDSKTLVRVILAVNVLTTVLVALTERIICRGRW